jgi:serine/threonine-protein kinase
MANPAADDLFACWLGRSAPAIPVTSVRGLLEAIRQHDLVTTAQLFTLMQEDARGRYAGPRSLAGDLIKRGWVTVYQVNLLLQGRGDDLLLGPYLLLERLGEGGTGQVFKARHVRMNRIVALKVIRRDLVADNDALGRFYREIQVVSQLAHPNLVHAFDAGPAGATHFLAMEYVDGVDLARLVKEHGPLPVAKACSYIRQTALALQQIHQHGLVHRDIKPQNLLLASGGRKSPEPPGANVPGSPGVVKLLDLGLARLQESVHGKSTTHLPDGRSLTTLTLAGPVTIGTVDYMAPEQALDFHQVDIRADIYSLGCTFWFLLTGKPPFPGGTLAQKLMKHQQAELPPLHEQRPGLPAALEPLLKQMLAKRPEDRFRTPAELVRMLDTIPVDPASPSPKPGLLNLVAAFSSPPRLILAGGGLLLAGLLALCLIFPLTGTTESSLPGPDRIEPPGPVAKSTGPAVGLPTAPAGKSIRMVLQGPRLVRDALIDPQEPDRKFGAVASDNRLRKSESSTALLIYFDLQKAGLTRAVKIDKATLTFHVWDPHNNARTKVGVVLVKTPWDSDVTWNQPAAGRRWQGGGGVSASDAGAILGHVVVQPLADPDIADPPIPYRLDITRAVQHWVNDPSSNCGLALLPVDDRAVDDGNQSRFQVHASEHHRVQYTPALSIEMTR